MEIIVGGLIEKDGKFLLVQEAKEKCRGKWSFPAGHLESNETVLEGAKREIFEETGCKADLCGILQIINEIDKDNTALIIVFKVKIIDDNIKFDTNEILDVKYFTYEEILDIKNNLRDPNLILSVIESYKSDKICGLDIIKTFK